MVLLITTALGAPCEVPTSDQDAKSLTAEAEEAFVNLDAGGFTHARDELLATIGCTNEVLSSTSIAGYFRVRALDAHLRRAVGDLKLNARAVAEIDPSPLSSSLAPNGHPVRNAWLEARANKPSSTHDLPVPLDGRILVDGRDTLAFPDERPTLLQWIDDDGTIRWTSVYESGAPPPSYPSASEEHRDKYEDAILVAAPRKPIALPILAGAFGAAALGVYAATFSTRKQFGRADDPGQLRSLYTTNNALVITASGLGLASVGLGVYAAATW